MFLCAKLWLWSPHIWYTSHFSLHTFHQSRPRVSLHFTVCLHQLSMSQCMEELCRYILIDVLMQQGIAFCVGLDPHILVCCSNPAIKFQCVASTAIYFFRVFFTEVDTYLPFTYKATCWSVKRLCSIAHARHNYMWGISGHGDPFIVKSMVTWWIRLQHWCNGDTLHQDVQCIATN